MLRSLSVGSYACNDTGRFVEGRDTWSFPDATPNAFGTSAQLVGAGRFASHYNDAPWQFVQVFSAADRAQLDAFTAALAPGALITLEEDTGTASSRIRTVDSTLVTTTGFTRVMVSGTREPAWRGSSQTFSLSIAANEGTVALPTVGGTLAAEMDIAVMHASAGSFSALGIKHAPLAGYDPIDGNGGTFSTPVALSTTPATVWAGTAFSVSANRGSHVLVAFLLHTATVASTLVWRSTSNLLTAVRKSVPVRSAVANTSERVNLGLVSVPAASLPDGSEGVVYGAEAADSSYTPAGTTVVLGTDGIGETFSHSGGEHTGVTLKLKNTTGAAETLSVGLYATSGTNPNAIPSGAYLASRDISVPAGHDGTIRVTWNAVLAAGTYCWRARKQTGGVTVSSPLLAYQDSAAGYASGNGISMLNGSTWVAGRYAATATTITQNAYNTTDSLTDTDAITQTFAATGRVQSVSIWASSTAYGGGTFSVQTAGGTVLGSQTITAGAVAKRTITLDTADYAGQTLTITVSVNTVSPEGVGVHRNTTSVYAGGACSLGGDLRFEVTERVNSGFDAYFVSYRRSVTNFNASTPITATCTQSGKTASYMASARLPADIGAVVVQTAFSAGEGWSYDAESQSVYPANSSGVTGTALPAYSVGTLSPLPGENTLVVFSGGGATTITGTITDLRITRG